MQAYKRSIKLKLESYLAAVDFSFIIQIMKIRLGNIRNTLIELEVVGK